MAIKKIGILAKKSKPLAIRTVRDLIDWLAPHGVEVFLEEECAREFAGMKGFPPQEIPHLVDLVVVVGGDGTFLRAARMVGDSGCPLLGINLGGLGFLTETTLSEFLPTVERVLAGKYRISQRMRLEAQHWRRGEIINHYTVLNDVVINKGALARIIELNTYIDGKHLTTFRADGLIVSTPTGSTAYCMAAGGPIVYPFLEVIILAPICPHTLSNRPLVVPVSSRIRIELSSIGEEVYLTLDGQIGITMEKGDGVEVGKAQKYLQVVSFPDRDYFDLLRAKLKWGER